MASLGNRLIAYIGSLELVGGDHDGAPFEVLSWERRFLRGAFSRDGDCALTVGRGNGKSALVGAIASAVVDPDGPLHGRRREVVVVAASFEQSRIIFEDSVAFLASKFNLGDRRTWRKLDTSNRASLEHRPSGAKIRCVGSNPGGMHGLRPALALLDEPAQWETAKADRALQAIRTGLGKVPGSKLIALGTRAADDGHWFSRLLRTAAYRQVHSARPSDPPFRVRTIRRANPSFDHLPSLRARIRAEAADAKIDPDALASYKALRLNQGVSDVARSVLLDGDTWMRAEGAGWLGRGGPYVLGLDLGQNQAMSAAAGYWRGGLLDAVAVFPERPSLEARGLTDGCGRLYVHMRDRGELVQGGGRVADIGALLDTVLDRWGRPVAIVIDRWREAELRQHLEAIRFPMATVETRGQGFRDGGQDVRDFRAAVLGGHVRPVESLLMRSAMYEARVVSDPAGNRKLAKGSQGGRRYRAKDDAAAAAILAVSAGYRQWHTGGRSSRPLRSAVV